MAVLSEPTSSPRPPRVDPGTLPTPVQKFLERALVDSESRAQTVHLRQSAELRMGPEKAWMPISCEQVIALTEPGFVWFADQRRGPVSVFRVIDALVRGRGTLSARLFGSIPLAQLSGPAADHSESMRYLAELPWSPDAVLLNPSLCWRALGEESVEVEADTRGGRATVRLYFDEAGDVVEMQADERGSTEKGVVVPRPWRGRFSEHGVMGGRRIPTRGEVGYVYETGYAAYWRGRITEYRLLPEAAPSPRAASSNSPRVDDPRA